MLSTKRFLFINFYLCICIELCAGAAFFPTNSAYGIFAAIAVPLELPHRNVFLSYNFEANYNLPYTWDIPPVAYGIEEDDLFGQSRDCTNCTTSNESARSKQTSKNDDEEEDNLETTTILNDEDETQNSTRTTRKVPRIKNAKKRVTRSLLSRTHFYHILKDKFERSGYKGEACLLRLICETNASELGDINGILGNLIHIIFSPSTSMNEDLPLSYYQAEVDGVHEQCEHYEGECEENLLDFISKPLVDIIRTMMPNKEFL